MIYMKSGTQHVLILEPGNLDEMKNGRPAMSPNKEVMIAYTPDIMWLTEQLKGIVDVDGEMDVKKLDDLLKEGLKRFPVYNRPYHEKIEFVKGRSS